MRHIHLDAVGGVAGDMFTAALLHAFPEHEAAVIRAASSLSGAPCQLLPHRDSVLTGARFDVAAPSDGRAVDDGEHQQHDHGHDHGYSHSHGNGQGHGHTHWSNIRARLAAATDLSEGARRHALGIFTALAEAEGRVHGIEPEAVAFHEVGAADSIADIVAAATLIDRLAPATWSVGPLPLGGGMVRTAHGMLPVPAPATALLLEGLETVDDGVGGERVTPTGAAILRHLSPGSRPAGRLERSGHGFGTRTLPGRSNVLRVLVFATTPAEPRAPEHRELAVITFEVDDQSPEDLAAGIDRLRAAPGVHDVLQMAAFGKKGRMTTHVQVLARPDALDDVVAGCFRETTTIGLRTHLVQGRALAREMRDVDVGGVRVRVKRVERPGGATGKAEADDVLALDSHAARARLRRAAETLAEETRVE